LAQVLSAFLHCVQKKTPTYIFSYNFSVSWSILLLFVPMETGTRNKSNDHFESLQYRQDERQIAHYHKRKHSPSYKRCSENRNNTCVENRKIRGLIFDTLYWRHLAAYRKI